MGFDGVCNTGLVLSLGFSYTADTKTTNPAKKAEMTAVSFEPSLTLGLSGESSYDRSYKKVDRVNTKGNNDQSRGDLYRQDSAASSFSNVSVKKEREVGMTGSEEAETERVSSRMISDDGVNGRKKLRLMKTQSALLEESFKQHSTLNPKQKQELARELNLRPRQVEVWFQNRRARTKLKQTEVDCEYLKKCCETLTDENRRLQKELQELKAIKLVSQPFYMPLPAATLTMCPSCEHIGDRERDNSSTKTTFTMAPKPHFFNPFTNPSAAC